MCIVIAGIGSACPTRNELKIACINNPDGFGWAIVSQTPQGKKLDVKRSMISAIAIDTFLDRMSALSDSVIAWTFHARIYTHGEISLANTHPFYVGDDKYTVLAHNGILPVSIGKDDKRSDSKVFAEDYLPEVGGIVGLNNSVISELVEGFVYGSNSKVVIVTAHPKAEYALIIFGETSGYWRKGKNGKDIWFSNRSYEPYRSYSEGWKTTYDKFEAPDKVRGITSTNRYDQYTAGGFEKDMADVKASLLSKREADESALFTRCIDKDCKGLVAENEDNCRTCDMCQSCGYDRLACLCWEPSLTARERADMAAALATEERSL